MPVDTVFPPPDNTVPPETLGCFKFDDTEDHRGSSFKFLCLGGGTGGPMDGDSCLFSGGIYCVLRLDPGGGGKLAVPPDFVLGSCSPG